MLVHIYIYIYMQCGMYVEYMLLYIQTIYVQYVTVRFGIITKTGLGKVVGNYSTGTVPID